MSGAPSLTMLVRGCDPARAPADLLPYLDCVDGAICLGGQQDRHGRWVSHSWALCRGGVQVGIVTLEGGPKPIRPRRSEPTLADLARERQAQRFPALLAGIAAALMGVTLALLLVGLFLLGTHHPA